MGICHKLYEEMSYAVLGDVLSCMGRCPKLYGDVLRCNMIEILNLLMLYGEMS